MKLLSELILIDGTPAVDAGRTLFLLTENGVKEVTEWGIHFPRGDADPYISGIVDRGERQTLYTASLYGLKSAAINAYADVFEETLKSLRAQAERIAATEAAVAEARTP